MLGAGGMGTAYLALHPDSGQMLVVKRMHPELMRDQTIFKRFVHEAEVSAHVRHKNVAALVAMGTIDTEPFLAMEFVFGIQCSRIVDRVEESLIDPVPLGIGLHLGVEMVSGLGAIHEAVHRDTGEPLGLIHRDVGARNVLIGFDGRVRVIDFGLGKSILSDWHTAHEVLAGSPDYMPPEQAMGVRVDARADVYAAAVTIWELLVGKKRIREDSVPGRLQRAIGAQPEPLVEYRPDAPKRLEAILKTAMHPDPDRRTATAALFKKTLSEEALSAARRMTREDIISWLDVACATIIAREKRELEDAKVAAEKLLARQPRHRPRTQLFVGQDALSSPGSLRFYQVDDAPEELEIVEQQSAGGLPSVEKIAALADPRNFAAAPTRTRVVFLAIAGLLLISIAALSAYVVSPNEPDVKVTALPAPPVTPPPAAPPPPVEEVKLVAPTPPPDLPPPPPSKRVAPPPSVKVDPGVAKRRRRLLKKIRDLRKLNFEVDFQRRLTKVSARLSRAKSQTTLDEIENTLRRMEDES